MNNIIYFGFCMIILLCFLGCGKHEAEIGGAGTAVGAVAGATLSNDKNRAGNTLLGALVGNAIGRFVGREEDLEDAKDKNKEEIVLLEQENQELKKRLEKWCSSCKKMVNSSTAIYCSRCGNRLVTQKFCRFCKAFFRIDSEDRYCPSCPERVLLTCR